MLEIHFSLTLEQWGIKREHREYNLAHEIFLRLHSMQEMPQAQERMPVELAVAAAIQQIAHAVILHSRWCVVEHGLTGPQIATLRAACELQPCTAGALARAVHLSQATLTGILDRLERRGFLVRTRGERDRRSVLISVTEAGSAAVAGVPSRLHATFRAELVKLPEWEQLMILASLQRVAGMMQSAAAPPVTNPLPARNGRRRTRGQEALPRSGEAS